MGTATGNYALSLSALDSLPLSALPLSALPLSVLCVLLLSWNAVFFLLWTLYPILTHVHHFVDLLFLVILTFASVGIELACSSLYRE